MNHRSRKGVGRQRGLTRGNPSYARDLRLFSVPFFLCPLRSNQFDDKGACSIVVVRVSGILLILGTSRAAPPEWQAVCAAWSLFLWCSTRTLGKQAPDAISLKRPSLSFPMASFPLTRAVLQVENAPDLLQSRNFHEKKTKNTPWSTLTMTGRRFLRTMEWSPARPG